MGLRISKIDEYAVAQILRHEPAETTHDLSGASVIGRNDLAQVLRVHTGRERCRTDQIAKHHRDLAALGALQRQRHGGCFDGTRRWAGLNGLQITNGTQDLAAMAERCNADLFEVLIGQVTENREIDVVVGKGLGILGQAELFEPVRNRLHRGPSPWISCLTTLPGQGAVYPINCRYRASPKDEIYYGRKRKHGRCPRSHDSGPDPSPSGPELSSNG